MGTENSPTLKIDEDFKNLIRPLLKQEYLQLEANILEDGCRDPITVWNRTIVDGHNRYEICKRHGIPFRIHKVSFSCREEAIAWICANQLGRRNLTEETRKFLIGLQYENEKIVNSRKNAKGHNQYSTSNDTNPSEQVKPPDNHYSRSRTATKIADANHISRGTVEKYAIYTRALEEIGKKEPKLVPKILSGKYKISHNGVTELAKLHREEVKNINRRLEQTGTPFAKYMTTRQEIKNSAQAKQPSSAPSIKDMPVYDPDAEIAGLTLTIPSWISSVARIQNGPDLQNASGSAKQKLKTALLNLTNTINDLLCTIKEV